jgi:hypothetical protein
MLKEDKENTIQRAEEKKNRNILWTALRNILPVTVCLRNSTQASSTTVHMD